MEYKEVDLSQWVQTGEGGNGKTYTNAQEPDRLLKLNNPPLCSIDFVQHEYETSKAVESLGIPVPQTFGIVRIGDAYATISQRIANKRSLSRICGDEPARTAEMAELFCSLAKEMFATECNTSIFPGRKERTLASIDKVRFVRSKDLDIIRRFAESIDDDTHCVHGDFHPGNVIQADSKNYWIDLDRFGYGNPMYDISHLYQICNLYSSTRQLQNLFHMSEELLRRFWDAFATAYTGSSNHSDFDAEAGRFTVLDIIYRLGLYPSKTVVKLYYAYWIRRMMKLYF